jgi:hypothetical protein
VPEADTETVFLIERSLDRVKKVFIAINGLAAYVALDVVMMSFLCVVIDKSAIRLALKHAAQLMKKIQSPVDGRFVNFGHSGLDSTDDVFPSQVSTRLMDNG